ncbi:MAG: hypothetical protein WAU91_04995, partial [Desulfatitalea sp.]
TWGTPKQIPSDDSKCASFPQIAMDAAGNGIVIYQCEGSTWAIRFDGTAWGTGEKISSDNSSSPQIVMNAAGNAIVVWECEGSIWARRFE